jgi:hypothetical protein
MDHNKSVLERAFDLAKSGEHETTETIKRQLAKEGYSAGQIFGPSLHKQLRGLIAAARESKAQTAESPKDEEQVKG